MSGFRWINLVFIVSCIAQESSPPEKKESAPSEDTGGATPPRGPTGADGTYNCDDFDTQDQAQQYFDEKGDVDGLDRDSDGVPCETLP